MNWLQAQFPSSDTFFGVTYVVEYACHVGMGKGQRVGCGMGVRGRVGWWVGCSLLNWLVLFGLNV